MKKRAKEGSGQRLWREAKKIIPGGSQLLSKRSEMLLPDQWPAYYSHAKGVEMWDLDGKKYIDMGRMAVGACVLGYADRDVNTAVKAAVDKGSIATLNPPEDVELAKMMLKIHPWAKSVRYARTGGEAMGVAVRIARAHTGRDIIAFCGYHGWLDWYLATNLGTPNALKEHLLEGLKPKGVPKGLRGTVLPFRYNQIDELRAIVKHAGKNLAAIVMEPIHSEEPKDGFLHKVRRLATQSGALLVFDEVSIGWKLCYGGAHLKYKVNPDIAVFSKTLSNGFPMAAIIGRHAPMQAAQESFISSSYWTDRIGPVAAIATLKKMKRLDIPKIIERLAKQMRAMWATAARKHGLILRIYSTYPYNLFSFVHEDAQALKTLFTQGMYERGILATTEFNPTAAHTQAHMKKYQKALDEVFAEIKEAVQAGDVRKRLKGPVAHTTFTRLN